MAAGGALHLTQPVWQPQPGGMMMQDDAGPAHDQGDNG